MKSTPNESYPKLLPWLAREAGVPTARARMLWHRAAAFADRLARRNTPVWSRLAIDHLRTSLQAEAAAMSRGAAVGRLWLLPARLGLLVAEACERSVLAACGLRPVRR